VGKLEETLKESHGQFIRGGSRWVPTDNKKAQLSLTNPRNAKAYQKLFQFDVLTNVVADNAGLSSFV